MTHEWSVAVTDLLLSVETAWFVKQLAGQSAAPSALRLLSVLFFSFLSLSSLTGACYHAFFRSTTTPGGWILWAVTALSIGVVTGVLCLLGGLATGGERLMRRIFPAVSGGFLVFSGIILFKNAGFTTILLFYVPTLLFLTGVSVFQWARTGKRAWLELLAGLLLSFGAAAVQYFRIGVHEVYFNHNALYHAIQAVALLWMYLSFRHWPGEIAHYG